MKGLIFWAFSWNSWEVDVTITQDELGPTFLSPQASAALLHIMPGKHSDKCTRVNTSGLKSESVSCSVLFYPLRPHGPHQAPLSMEFSRQEYWGGLPCPPPGDLPDPGIKPGSPALQADSLPAEPPGNPIWSHLGLYLILLVLTSRK